MKKICVAVCFLALLVAFKADKPAYTLFAKGGKTSDYADMLKKLQKADVVLFGELHDNPVVHWLELQVTKDLYAVKQKNLVLAAEMFEADAQLVLDEYLLGLHKDANFEKESKIWDNYPTDYAALVKFAKTNGLPFVAANVPRRYASLVSRNGLQALNNLTPEAKRFMAPLPIAFDITLPGYQNMLAMMGGMQHGNSEYFVQAQAIKDATMAHFIAKAATDQKLVLHFNGAYHSNNFEGIVWYLQKINPKLNVVTISSVEQDEIEKLAAENQSLADFIICTPTDMVKTY